MQEGAPDVADYIAWREIGASVTRRTELEKEMMEMYQFANAAALPAYKNIIRRLDIHDHAPAAGVDRQDIHDHAPAARVDRQEQVQAHLRRSWLVHVRVKVCGLQ